MPRHPDPHQSERTKAAGSPIIAGFLFSVLGNDELMTVSLIMCSGAVLGAALLWFLPNDDADAELAAAEVIADNEARAAEAAAAARPA